MIIKIFLMFAFYVAFFDCIVITYCNVVTWFNGDVPENPFIFFMKFTGKVVTFVIYVMLALKFNGLIDMKWL